MKNLAPNVYAVAARPAPGRRLQVVGESHNSLELAQDARAADKAANDRPTAVYRLAFGSVPIFVEGDNLGEGPN